MNKIKVLHLSTHLGGGIGTVVRNWLNKEILWDTDYEHSVFTLEKTNNFMDEFRKINIRLEENIFYDVTDPTKLPMLYNEMSKADLLVIHWYNNPLLATILTRLMFPPCRMIIWDHVSSLNAPYNIPEKLLDMCDRFIFTSPVTYEAEEIKNLPDRLKAKLGVVWSAFGSEDFKHIEKKPHEGFNIGLTGTVDYAKLHPSFIKMSSDVKIPNSKFIVCSGDAQNTLKQDAEKLGVSDRFSFEGRVPSIWEYLPKFDVFGYPLQPKHLGTCEQALGEAMLVGVVPVVMNNPAEKYIVQDGYSGLVAHSEREYSMCIKYLYDHPEYMDQLSERAKKVALEKYSMRKKVMAWDEIFKTTLRIPKTSKEWKSEVTCREGHQVFIESIGLYGEIFKQDVIYSDASKLFKIHELFKSNGQWYSRSKGGVRQYLRYYPDDPHLQRWEFLLRVEN